MRVSLLAFTPRPEHMVASAAKLCYSSTSIEDLTENMTDHKAGSFVDMLCEIGHESPIEHAAFTFGIEGVSRSLLAQITRHRIASYSVQSQRYVRESGFEYVIPPQIDALPQAREIYLRAMQEDMEHYERLTAILQKKHTDELIKGGMDEKEAARVAEKTAIEDARFVLPNACATKIIVTMNARSLNNFFALRCCNRAQWEIRELAEKMLELCFDAAPNIFKHSGPPCVSGACPEGKMSCGKTAKVRERYRQIKGQK